MMGREMENTVPVGMIARMQPDFIVETACSRAVNNVIVVRAYQAVVHSMEEIAQVSPCSMGPIAQILATRVLLPVRDRPRIAVIVLCKAGNNATAQRIPMRECFAKPAQDQTEKENAQVAMTAPTFPLLLPVLLQGVAVQGMEFVEEMGQSLEPAQIPRFVFWAIQQNLVGRVRPIVIAIARLEATAFAPMIHSKPREHAPVPITAPVESCAPGKKTGRICRAQQRFFVEMDLWMMGKHATMEMIPTPMRVQHNVKKISVAMDI